METQNQNSLYSFKKITLLKGVEFQKALWVSVALGGLVGLIAMFVPFVTFVSGFISGFLISFLSYHGISIQKNPVQVLLTVFVFIFLMNIIF